MYVCQLYNKGFDIHGQKNYTEENRILNTCKWICCIRCPCTYSSSL